MFRTVIVYASKNPNVIFRRGKLFAVTNIKKGQEITVSKFQTNAPVTRSMKRNVEEISEIDRLHRVAIKHALKN